MFTNTTNNMFTRLRDEGTQMTQSESAWERKLEDAMDRAEREDEFDADHYYDLLDAGYYDC